jgi:hypothetical protein
MNWYKLAFFGEYILAARHLDYRDVYDIYQLEYKMQKLLREAEDISQYIEPDDLNVYYLKVKHKLQKIVDKLHSVLYDIFSAWIIYHLRYYGMDWLEDEERKDVWENIQDVNSMLQNATELSEKIAAINFAIHICHTTGMMVELGEYYDREGYSDSLNIPGYLSGANYIALKNTLGPKRTKEILDDFSGGEFIPEWEEEYVRREANKINWYKFALNNTSSGQAYWIDQNGKIIPVVEHIEYIMDNIDQFSPLSEKDIVEFLKNTRGNNSNLSNDLLGVLLKDFIVENTDWVRAHVQLGQNAHILINCRDLSSYSDLKRIEDFIFNINPPEYTNIVIEDLNNRTIEFIWRDFIQNSQGMSFVDFVKRL